LAEPVLRPGHEDGAGGVQTGYLSNRRPAPYAPNREVYDLNVREPKLYAYDKASGRLLAQIDLPANASGAPMTYMAGGKQ